MTTPNDLPPCSSALAKKALSLKMTPAPSNPWYTHLTLDLVLLVLSRTLFHPFIAFMLPLSLRALATPLTHPSFLLTSGYFLAVSAWWLGSEISAGLARNGGPRDVCAGDEEEVVVVTGGGRGLGACVAEIYGFRGGSVAVLDLEVEEGEGEGVRRYRCDVGDREQVERVWGRIVKELGTPTVLINNAATVHGKRFLDLTMEEIERTFRTNTLSHYHLASLFLPSLLSRPGGGTLVTISSVLAHLGASHLSDYAASKAALIAFHSSLSAEFASTPNIKTILVTPGQLDTGLFAGVRLGWVGRFFGPVVEVGELAVKLVAMIDSGEGGVLAVPAYARWIGWMAVLPSGLQRVLRDWSGVDKAMVGFGSQDTRTVVDDNI